ncbi:EsV-1-107 [Ectocarpus siliculosus virus 1]|uniref:EsV-1-107 n=1 Tax=Ectocarpus siliculosus virus 1 (isolate New Zealand/Kaikoura/1988) TaxID=654926 RepID=Q8QNH1_ESV1K|nr:EsV-1-107 [Ectocarpus siliculosus virus 1]AAK14525.1 EsV-1-107 [Ectocarpus siliculosus virus 1]
MVPYASLRRAGMSHMLPEPNIFILFGQHFPQPFFRAQNVHEIIVWGISGITNTITSPGAKPAHACHNLVPPCPCPAPQSSRVPSWLFLRAPVV